MENMDKGLTLPKWVLIVWQKIPQMPQNLSAQFVWPSPKVLDFNDKRLHWASVLRACTYLNSKRFRNFYFVMHIITAKELLFLTSIYVCKCFWVLKSLWSFFYESKFCKRIKDFYNLLPISVIKCWLTRSKGISNSKRELGIEVAITSF
jgi:hypothetical protein